MLDHLELCRHLLVAKTHGLREDHGVGQFLIKRIYGETLVLLPGAHSVRQGFADMQMMPRRSRDGWWGLGGLLTSAEALFRDVFDRFNPHDVPSGPYCIVAHSQGVPIGLYLAAFLCRRYQNVPIRMVGFGGPKSGYVALVKALRRVDITLYRCGSDIVPGMPLGLWYRHPRPICHIGKRGPWGYHDHHLPRYIEAMEERVRKMGMHPSSS